MGVPKFYRWMSERYPCLSQVVAADNVPEIDNFYLDMNGIVHQCSHPTDLDPSIVWTEQQIFVNIVAYLENLVAVIRPKRLLYMAIDGVAPRAKMNQQRARRFRSADEAAAEAKRLAAKGIDVRGKFDSNSITPGTPFMVRLAEYLQEFVQNKLATDVLWKTFKVIISGHEVPGEGEHKIMDYIRAYKLSAEYDHHARHCLYGLDADLIILGLASHEPYFFLLREEQTFGRKKSKKDSGDVRFHLLSLTLFRDYIAIEFAPLKHTLPFEWSFERLLDDWILLTFLVGNDFLPHLPGFHINEDIFPMLWRTYAASLAKAGGYLSEHGRINMAHLETLFRELDAFDRSIVENKMQDMAFVQAKMGPSGRGRGGPRNASSTSSHGAAFGGASHGRPSHASSLAPLQAPSHAPSHTPSHAPTPVPGFRPAGPAAAAPGNLVSFFTNDETFDFGGGAGGADGAGGAENELVGADDAEIAAIEFRQQKRSYYMEKLHVEVVDDVLLNRLAREYVMGLQWCLLYYFQGVPSWSWYFNAHYTPHVSDIRNFTDYVPQFDLSRPFMPFQQLLSVMPAACAALLPEAYRDLMTNSASPIADFYPKTYATDLNGKKNEWEAVVLIPFIDERRLLQAVAERERYLTTEERSRNRHSLPCSVAVTSEGSVTVTQMEWPHCQPGRDVYPELSPLFRPTELLVGIPTLSHVPFTVEMRRGAVQLFDRPSTGESVIVTPTTTLPADLAALARALAAERIFCNWPYLREARLVSMTNGVQLFSAQGTELMSNTDQAGFNATLGLITDALMRRSGIALPPNPVIAYVNPSVGAVLKTNDATSFSMQTQFSAELVPVPLALLVRNPEIFALKTGLVPVAEVFPVGDMVFFTGPSLYGAFGTVLSMTSRDNQPVIKVELRVPASGPPGPAESDEREVLSTRELAARLKINQLLVLRIAGSLYTEANGRVDLGLGFYGQNKTEMPKYARRAPHTVVTPAGENAIKDYVMRFRAAVDQWDQQMQMNENGMLYTDPAVAAEITSHLAGLPFRKDPQIMMGTQMLSAARMRVIANFSARCPALSAPFQMDVSPGHLLSRTMITLTNTAPDPEGQILLGDRVITVRGPVPASPTAGTVVAVYPSGQVDVVLDQPVLDGGDLDGTCQDGHGLQLSVTHLLSVSHGNRRRGTPLEIPAGASKGKKARSNASLPVGPAAAAPAAAGTVAAVGLLPASATGLATLPLPGSNTPAVAAAVAPGKAVNPTAAPGPAVASIPASAAAVAPTPAPAAAAAAAASDAGDPEHPDFLANMWRSMVLAAQAKSDSSSSTTTTTAAPGPGTPKGKVKNPAAVNPTVSPPKAAVAQPLGNPGPATTPAKKPPAKQQPQQLQQPAAGGGPGPVAAGAVANTPGKQKQQKAKKSADPIVPGGNSLLLPGAVLPQAPVPSGPRPLLPAGAVQFAPPVAARPPFVPIPLIPGPHPQLRPTNPGPRAPLMRPPYPQPPRPAFHGATPAAAAVPQVPLAFQPAAPASTVVNPKFGDMW